MERRLIELRATGDGKRTIGGEIPYNKPSVLIWGMFRELIAPGAFAASIANNDVRALWNHEMSQPIGRSSNNSLRFSDGKDALGFEIDLPDTQVGRDAYELIRNGYVSQMSFGFTVLPDGSKWHTDADGADVRTLTNVNLIEVSPVTIPAYPETTVGLRALFGDEVQIPGEGRRASPSPSVDSAVEQERALVQIRRRRLDLLDRLERER